MIGTILLFVLGLIMLIEAIIILLFPRQIKTLVNSLFKHHIILQIIAILELIIGLTIILVIIL